MRLKEWNIKQACWLCRKHSATFDEDTELNGTEYQMKAAVGKN